MLADAGFEVIGPALTVAAALEQIRKAPPDAAVLDVNLRGERVTPVAEVLLAIKVPFVLASAYLPSDLAGEPALAGAKNVGKPTSRTALIGALREYRARAPG